MPAFDGKEFCVELSPFSKKQGVVKKIKDNGGKVGFGITKNTHFVVADSSSVISPYKLSLILRGKVQIVNTSYVDACIENQAILDVTPFLIQRGMLT